MDVSSNLNGIFNFVLNICLFILYCINCNLSKNDQIVVIPLYVIGLSGIDYYG